MVLNSPVQGDGLNFWAQAIKTGADIAYKK
ncbi:hypothetical protein X474_07150 [Dethiosulfatarculus sandiegensis]|uniref:Uncharacterized protein n=1 Tax=Dethiosulfatarculus sandiegensis TaxID=1429043 RepID=A0A0D2HX24_9BACT|nr:hypothetical protein X474_07150 [Dethiosulfatarculus sandiegensis]